MSEREAAITMKGNPLTLLGKEINVGSMAPDATLVANDLSEVKLSSFKGKKVILSVVPSLDTPVCDLQVREFNKKAAKVSSDVVILGISKDLPFAQKRFCGAEGLENVVNLSDFSEGSFGKTNGLEITDGPLAGLHSRVIIVVDENGTITHTEQVAEIADEPNYEAALAVL